MESTPAGLRVRYGRENRLASAGSGEPEEWNRGPRPRHCKLHPVQPRPSPRRQRGRSAPLAPEERGALFEGWVFSLLRAYAEEKAVFNDIHYRSPAESRVEVDFLLRRDRAFLTVEAKAGERYHAGMLRGLRAVGGLAGLTRWILVSGGRRSFRTDDGIEIWPAVRFAEKLAEDALWP